MPVIPSFSGYAPAPRLAESWLGGRRIAEEAVSNAARIQLGYAQLQAERERSQAQLAAQQEMAAQKALQDAHESDVMHQYRNMAIGMQEKGLKLQEQAQTRLMMEAAQGFERQQQYHRLQSKYAAEAMARGMDAVSAAAEGANRASLEMGGTGMASALSRQGSDMERLRFEAAKLNAEENNLLRLDPFSKYGQLKPETRTKLEDIQRRRYQLQIPQTIGTGTNTQRRLRYNPDTGDFE